MPQASLTMAALAAASFSITCTSCSLKPGRAAPRERCHLGPQTFWRLQILNIYSLGALQGRPAASEELAWEAAVRGPLLVSILEAYRAVSPDAWRVELT